MYRLLTPILALIVALTLFFTFIRPTFEEYKSIDTEIGDYDQALTKAQELQDRVSELVLQKNSMNQSDVEKLMVFLPGSVDEVGVVLILDALASRHDLVLENISVKSAQANGIGASDMTAGKFAFEDNPAELAQNVVREDGTVARQPMDRVEITSISFGVTGEYQHFRDFVTDLEKSLAMVDIASLSISEPAEGKFTTYTLGVVLYQFTEEDQ